MSTEPVVVGIDTNTFGFHVVSSGPINQWQDIEVRRSTVGYCQFAPTDVQERRMLTFRAAWAFFTEMPPATAVFVEEPILMRTNYNTTMKLMMAAGVIESAFFGAVPDATFFWVPLGEWRKQVLGKGSGRKGEMKALAKQHVQSNLPEELVPIYELEEDLYEAHCIMEYGQWALASEEARLR